MALRPHKQGGSEKTKVEIIGGVIVRGSPQTAFKNGRVVNIEDGIGEGSPQTASKTAKVTKEEWCKKKKGKGSVDVFTVHGNTINGGKADKCGVFGIGVKYIGTKKPKDVKSSEEESDSSGEDEE